MVKRHLPSVLDQLSHLEEKVKQKNFLRKKEKNALVSPLCVSVLGKKSSMEHCQKNNGNLSKIIIMMDRLLFEILYSSLCGLLNVVMISLSPPLSLIFKSSFKNLISININRTRCYIQHARPTLPRAGQCYSLTLVQRKFEHNTCATLVRNRSNPSNQKK